MIWKTFGTLAFVVALGVAVQAQQEVRTYIFGHSLINHEFEVSPPTPSQETSVPHWLHFLAQAGGHSYAVSGQYGFLPQHMDLPPFAQWGFDFAAGAWDSDSEPFSLADFTDILITPGNFMQWQPPNANYPGETASPVSATHTVFDWCLEQEPTLDLYIYENWPEMAPFLGDGFPPNASEWSNYNTYLQGDFHQWFLDYYNQVAESFPNACVRMIPTGPSIGHLLQQSPFDQIPVAELYQDDAPHGRPTIYFLAALTTYMAIWEEKAPIDFVVDPIIHPVIAAEYETVVNTLWRSLQDYNEADDNQWVFCQIPVTSNPSQQANPEIEVFPNPGTYLQIQGATVPHRLNLYNSAGFPVCQFEAVQPGQQLQVDGLPEGLYLAVGYDQNGEVFYRKKWVLSR
ncbi:MAG: T9SS C-terminal target domain-containing protein [Phaeodactylibacter xiamenensis]|uniref:hypothetical protein n=1 Tax=Phaeodactylibacter xiamenensis TaxID=1524460 RepID=UPI0006986127|nr:hypothetical protein [Phaeodactylibacter xiamenensis]